MPVEVVEVLVSLINTFLLSESWGRSRLLFVDGEEGGVTRASFDSNSFSLKYNPFLLNDCDTGWKQLLENKLCTYKEFKLPTYLLKEDWKVLRLREGDVPGASFLLPTIRPDESFVAVNSNFWSPLAWLVAVEDFCSTERALTVTSSKWLQSITYTLLAAEDTDAKSYTTRVYF